MSYFKYQAEKGSAHALWYILKLIAFMALLFWPLAIGEHRNGDPSVIGYVLEAPWLVVLGVVALATGAGKKRGTRHR